MQADLEAVLKHLEAKPHAELTDEEERLLRHLRDYKRYSRQFEKRMIPPDIEDY